MSNMRGAMDALEGSITWDFISQQVYYIRMSNKTKGKNWMAVYICYDKDVRNMMRELIKNNDNLIHRFSFCNLVLGFWDFFLMSRPGMIFVSVSLIATIDVIMARTRTSYIYTYLLNTIT
jgi:hypothetical protein